jgi:hypothetical protein
MYTHVLATPDLAMPAEDNSLLEMILQIIIALRCNLHGQRYKGYFAQPLSLFVWPRRKKRSCEEIGCMRQ